MGKCRMFLTCLSLVLVGTDARYNELIDVIHPLLKKISSIVEI